jgi:2-dehydropantoate 2-reductase
MKIVIIGAGAVGSTLGILLKKSGQEVTLIGRARQVEAIRNQGLRVEGVLGKFTMALAACEKLDFRPDLVLLAVKTQDVLAAAKANLDFGDQAPWVTLQNGVQSDALLASLIPKKRILSAVVLLHANYLVPGSVTMMYEGGLVLGRPFGPKDSLLNEIAGVLNQALPTRISENIRGAHWLKLMVNLNNALPALTGLTIPQIYGDPFLSRLAVRLMREGLVAVQKAGIKLESLPNVSLGLTRLIRFMPVSLSARIAAAKVKKMETPWPLLASTLQSLKRSRPTEIDFLNGEVVALGDKTGCPTPLNARVVEWVHQVERTGKFLSIRELEELIRKEIQGGSEKVP